ncbi:MAG: hypothetical protein N2446_02740, partial [Elusimicrobiales bacterium]|nr:hypothetical protein [Elusimicrobiales bacterium]
GSTQTYSLTVSVSPSGEGSVSKNPNKTTYTAGEVVQLTAQAASGYVFSGWGGDLSGTANPTTIVMNSNKSVVAVFSRVDGGGVEGDSLVSDYIVLTPDGDGKGDRVDFSFDKNLTPTLVGVVNIYSIDGRRIKVIESAPYIWDGKVDGKYVRSGVYIYEYKTEKGEKKIGKILIVK